MTAPIVAGERAWVGGEPRPMQIRWSTGAVDWVADEVGDSDWNASIYSAPALDPVGGNYIYYGFRSRADPDWGGLPIVNRATGDLVAFYPGTFRSPIWTGETLYAIGGALWNEQELTARDELGAVIWTAAQSLGGSTGSPALGHGVLVAPGEDGAIMGFRAADGAMLWSHPVGVEIFDMAQTTRDLPGSEGAAAIADSVVYVGSLDGYLYALDLLTGAELWNWNLGIPVGSSPAISGNMLFVGASDGHLYGFVSTTPFVGTSSETSPARGLVFEFASPRPNPSATSTRFEWVLPERARVELAVFDLAGRKVRTLVNERLEPGKGSVTWDGSGDDGSQVASGIYFVRLKAGTETAVGKVVRLRR
jgi:outer membrane protein assembly factor BamB